MNDDWLDDIDSDDSIMHSCMRVFISIFGLWVIIFILCALFGCTTTRYVTVETTRTDTLRITKHERDSILIKDSTYVHEWGRNDTVFMEVVKWRTMYRTTEVHDTLYESHVDSVPYPVPYEVIQEVEKPLTWWQRTRMRFGDMLLLMIGIAIVYATAKIYRKFS